MEESRKYQITNEVLNAVTHGIAFILAILGLVLLVLKGSGSGLENTVVFAIYGASLTLLFFFSTLFHSLIFTKASKVLQVFDHSSIYLLIAGTYTPYCVLSVGGNQGFSLLVSIWILAILGIIYKSITLPKMTSVPKISTVIYIIMGWLCLTAIVPLWNNLPHLSFWLLVLGGIVYTSGAFFYTVKFPFNHVVWHLFVMLAACLMWFSVYLSA